MKRLSPANNLPLKESAQRSAASSSTCRVTIAITLCHLYTFSLFISSFHRLESNCRTVELLNNKNIVAPVNRDVAQVKVNDERDQIETPVAVTISTGGLNAALKREQGLRRTSSATTGRDGPAGACALACAARIVWRMFTFIFESRAQRKFRFSGTPLSGA